MSASYRYPGVKPFSQADSHLFFGRKQDILRLVRYLRTENLVVLHGKSGLGKTSLIHAGVIPLLNDGKRKQLPYTPLTFRFNSYNPRAPRSLTYIVEGNVAREPSFLDEIPVKHISLWQALKSKQLGEGAPTERPQYLLIFDQFEELFSYPEEDINDFVQDLADLINGVVPGEFRKTLRREEVVNPELKAQLDAEGLREWLESSLRVKILIAIRSDKFNLLDRISGTIPEILLNSQILEPLSREQADEAIELPAQMEGQFESPPFSYAPPARAAILDFLTSNRTRRVEGFQLQILCRNIEESLIEHIAAPTAAKSRIHFRQLPPEEAPLQYEVQEIDANFGDILRHYYDNQISKLAEAEHMVARRFIEDELIAEGRRVSMDRAAIKAEVSDDLLYKLVNSRLIRREPNSLGGFSYEISHDTLLDPILGARQERKIREEAETQREEAREAARKRQEELERQRDAKEKELAQAQAEKAELEKRRAKEQATAERRNKYFLLTLLILVLVIAGLTTFGLIKANQVNKELETTNNLLAQARDSLDVRARGLSMDLVSATAESDSVRRILSELPEEQQDFASYLGRMQSLRDRFNDTLSRYEGIPGGKVLIQNDRLIIRLHLFDNSQYALNPNKPEDLARIAFFQRMSDLVRQQDAFSLQVEVHTDRSGLVGSNLKNSMARAYSLSGPLFEVFSEDGDASRVAIVARGESDPIPGASKAENRRVDMVLYPRRQTQ